MIQVACICKCIYKCKDFNQPQHLESTHLFGVSRLAGEAFLPMEILQFTQTNSGGCRPAVWFVGELFFFSFFKGRVLGLCLDTNHWNKGRSSADRRTKPTLVRTEPRSLFKSSTKDSSLSTFEIVLWRYLPPRFWSSKHCAVYDAGPEGLSVFCSHRKR